MARRRSSRSRYGGSRFPENLTVAVRKLRAERLRGELQKEGRHLEPVVIDGKQISDTFWGKAWCDNLEAYSDLASRLPRGRSYVRSGSVVDLQIAEREVRALVSGTALYRVSIDVQPLDSKSWSAIVRQCQGGVASLVELLRGKIEGRVMQVVTQRPGGLFPSPAEIEFSCSCPDFASMCKHVAATFYGIGSRLDRQPELLFQLRGVDPADLVQTTAQDAGRLVRSSAPKSNVLHGVDLSSLFGVEIQDAPAQEPRKKKKATKRGPRRKPQ